MSGSKEGAAKAQRTIAEKYGKDANGKSKMHQKAGIKGGSTVPSSPRGFAANPELAKEMGKIGGKLGKRKKKEN